MGLTPEQEQRYSGYRPVARIIDKPLGTAIEWLDGITFEDDPALDDGTVLYVKDEA